MSILDQFLPQKTPWKFSTSQSGGICVNWPAPKISVCGGGGSYFVTDPTGQEHQLDYVSLEAGVALAISWVVSIFGAHKSFPSGGVGNIYQGPCSSKALTLDDLKAGMTAIITVSKGTVGASADMSLIFLGVPYIGVIDPLSLLRSNAVGLMWGLTARLEIGVAGISGGRGTIL